MAQELKILQGLIRLTHTVLIKQLQHGLPVIVVDNTWTMPRER